MPTLHAVGFPLSSVIAIGKGGGGIWCFSVDLPAPHDKVTGRLTSGVRRVDLQACTSLWTNVQTFTNNYCQFNYMMVKTSTFTIIVSHTHEFLLDFHTQCHIHQWFHCVNIDWCYWLCPRPRVTPDYSVGLPTIAR